MYDTVSAVLEKEEAVIDSILKVQRDLRKLVQAKDWKALEPMLHQLGSLGDTFSALEETRQQIAKGDFFRYLSTLEGEEKKQVTKRFTAIRRGLNASRAENKALKDYLRTMMDFLQGIFEKVIPNRRAKVYTKTGSLANLVPTQLVVDCRL